MEPVSDNPVFPQAKTVEEAKEYLDWHCREGRGKLVLMMRAMYVVIPPTGCTHDEDTVFLNGYL